MEPFDIFVIGGGINGCGIARDAAGRGYSVFLAEMNDLASGTSSWSTKLIHGGLRYLEHYEFRLVREALKEREVLWAMAPHIIRPLRFVLPYHRGLRPSWLLRTGLFIYDHIGGRKDLPPTKVLDLVNDPAGKPLKDQFKKAFEYSDCRVDDARLVVLNARDAADRGATIRTRSKVVAAERIEDRWAVTVENARTDERETIETRFLVNAAGPWVDAILHAALGRDTPDNVRLVQGSHIVVRRKYEHDRAYFFQNTDERIFFAIPYQKDFTLIGTTDRDYEGDAGDVAISDEEIAYLCEGASEYFREPVTRDDIVWTYSGVRPLFDDGASQAQEATRDYVLKSEGGNGHPPLINIFGGKITTYRRLAEAALESIADHIGERGKAWTLGARLPGGDFEKTGFEGQVARLRKSHPFLSGDHVERMIHLYGTQASAVLGSAKSTSDLGRHFGADLYEAEIRYLAHSEWALTADDILWRRTKLGLLFSAEETLKLQKYLESPPGQRLSQAAE